MSFRARWLRRRRRVAAFTALALLASLGGIATAIHFARRDGGGIPDGASADRPCTSSSVQLRELSRLALFTSWLARNNANGYVGEVGWPAGPDADTWNAVASAWYHQADSTGLWVSAWSASQWWPADYPMAAYRLPSAGSTPWAGPQAAVVAAEGSTDSAVRGVDVPTGAFGTADDGKQGYSNTNPGVYAVDYSYETYAGYQFLATHGIASVRLSFMWERLQPQPGGPLAAKAVEQLRSAVGLAHAAGLDVVLDLHSFGGYWVTVQSVSTRVPLGSAGLPIADLAQFWGEMSTAMHGVPGVIGYGLMNEPGRLAPLAQDGVRIWEQASQLAVTAIRSLGDNTTILVSGYGGSSPESFVALAPQAWINDPADSIRYEMHQYFDGDRSGHYALTYDQELAAAQDAGYRCLG